MRRASDQNVTGRAREPFHGAAHGKQTRPIDIDGIDLRHLSETDGPGNRALHFDLGRQPVARLRGELLESSTPAIFVAGAKMTAAAATGPASGLIPASSTPATWTTPFDHRSRSYRSMCRKPLAFGAVDRTTAVDGCQQLFGAGPGIGAKGFFRDGIDRMPIADMPAHEILQ